MALNNEEFLTSLIREALQRDLDKIGGLDNH